MSCLTFSPPMIKLVIFDLDGTLVDAYTAIEKSVRYALEAVQAPVPDKASIRRAVGWGDRNLLRAFVSEKKRTRRLRFTAGIMRMRSRVGAACSRVCEKLLTRLHGAGIIWRLQVTVPGASQ